MSDQTVAGKQWSLLTREEKRARRFSWFLEPDNVHFVNQAAKINYCDRAQRLVDVFNIQEPDRVPVMIFFGDTPLRLAGVSYREGIYDLDKAIKAYYKFNRQYAEELDNYANPVHIPAGKVFAILDYKLFVWPGHGLPDTANMFQFVEGEYMQPGEYDDLIRNPADFWTRTYLPRIFGSLGSFRSLDSVTDIIEMPTAQLAPLTLPEMQIALQKLIEAGQELRQRDTLLKPFRERELASGFPEIPQISTKAPFDIIGDTLRGTAGIMMDMYRRPDKLLAAIDIITDLLIRSTVEKANRLKTMMVMFPLHKGADGWMSPSQFAKFYWPSLKKVLDALIEEGLIIQLFAEGSYNTRLDSVNEFPSGTVHWWFDQTDMLRAKRILGDRCCLKGNVPSSLLVTGTPGEVKEYSRKLIETCGQGGGFILSPGAVNVESKIENLQALAAAAREYGVYHP
jgi:hypothetical protein